MAGKSLCSCSTPPSGLHKSLGPPALNLTAIKPSVAEQVPNSATVKYLPVLQPDWPLLPSLQRCGTTSGVTLTLDLESTLLLIQYTMVWKPPQYRAQCLKVTLQAGPTIIEFRGLVVQTPKLLLRIIRSRIAAM